MEERLAVGAMVKPRRLFLQQSNITLVQLSKNGSLQVLKLEQWIDGMKVKNSMIFVLNNVKWKSKAFIVMHRVVDLGFHFCWLRRLRVHNIQETLSWVSHEQDA